MRTKREFFAFAVIFLTIIVLIILGVMAWTSVPPMEGRITRKTSHPAYYPANYNTPTVYCLGITDHNGNRAVSWKVSKQIYDSYNIGDLTGEPSGLVGAAK